MIDQARQTAMLGTLAQALGKAAVDTSPQTLARYAVPGMAPAGVVLPGDEAQLARVLEAARSSGGVVQTVCNGAHGLEKAVQDKVIVLDLQKMNKVLEVNEQLATCLVEPGVTFRQLDAHICCVRSKRALVNGDQYPLEGHLRSFDGLKQGLKTNTAIMFCFI